MLSHFEHYHSKRPSTILDLFVLLIFLCHMTRTRTTWLAGQPLPVSILSTATLPILLLILVLESRTRVKFGEANTISSKEILGIFNRSVFWQLNPLFLFGRNHGLQQENLPTIDSKQLSSRAAPQPHEGWNSGELLRNHTIHWIILARMSWQVPGHFWSPRFKHIPPLS